MWVIIQNLFCSLWTVIVWRQLAAVRLPYSILFFKHGVCQLLLHHESLLGRYLRLIGYNLVVYHLMIVLRRHLLLRHRLHLLLLFSILLLWTIYPGKGSILDKYWDKVHLRWLDLLTTKYVLLLLILHFFLVIIEALGVNLHLSFNPVQTKLITNLSYPEKNKVDLHSLILCLLILYLIILIGWSRLLSCNTLFRYLFICNAIISAASIFECWSFRRWL